tara:strand:- start:1516 stop:3117 length:1602 start_codon:yes stop_codon:yes gene_type:complete
MANMNENININVNSNVGDVAKDTKNAAAEFKVMGVSLNGIKKGFASAATTAKGMFGSIKAGIISSGVGAFVVLVGSLIAYFKSTKDGAEKLERAMAGFGAVISVITDRLSGFGEVIVSAFENPQQAIADLWEAIKTNLLNRVQGIIDAFGYLGKTIQSALSFDWDEMKENAAGFGESIVQVATGVDDLTGKMAAGFKSLGEEINNDVAAAMKLKKLTQELRDEEREFNKVRAQTRQEIQKARLDALDESKTAEERLAALQKANELELKTTEDVLEMQRRKIEIQKETMALSENMAEDLDELANLEVELINLQTSSFQTQKRLATEMETLTNEIAANKKAKEKEEADDKAQKEKDRIATEKLNLQAWEDYKLKRIKGETDAEFKIRIDAAKKLEKAKQDLIGMGFAAAEQLAGKSEAAQKAVAVAKTIFNTQQGIMNAMANVPAPFNIAQAVATGVMGATSIQKILSTSSEGGGAGGGSVSAPTTPATPAPQMMSGAFDLSGGLEPEPTRAYVVTDEMTNSQNQLANIRRRATI